MTDTSKIREMIQKGISEAASNNRFSLNPVTRHTHNNVDSPYVFQPIITYVGKISFDGFATVLPKGWTHSGGAGVYTVTHNLPPSTIYIVSAIPSADSGSGSDSVSYSQGTNTSKVTFFVFNTTTGTPSACDFWFSLTVVNNSSPTLPTYSINVHP